MGVGVMRVLTVRQPWATLIALQIKRIETRSFATKYRGPVAIHAGLRKADVTETGIDPWRPLLAPGSDCRLAESLTFGAVVAVADLTDCLPIYDVSDDTGYHTGRPVLWKRDALFIDTEPKSKNPETLIDVSDQLPYGDFTPGRFGWLLDNVRPLSAPIPHKGGLGLRHATPELIAAIEAQS